MIAPLTILWIVGSLIAGWLGRKRRLGFWGTLLFSLLISPIVMILVLILAHPAKPKEA